MNSHVCPTCGRSSTHTPLHPGPIMTYGKKLAPHGSPEWIAQLRHLVSDAEVELWQKKSPTRDPWVIRENIAIGRLYGSRR